MSPVAEHLHQLIYNVLRIERMDSERGPNKWRRMERAALLWAIEQLADKYPKELAEAEEFAARREEARERDRQRDRVRGD